MKIKKFNESLSPDNMQSRIKEAAEEAQQAFWATVVEKFPEVTSGDFPPDATFEFDAACEKAVDIWVWGNTPDDISNDRY